MPVSIAFAWQQPMPTGRVVSNSRIVARNWRKRSALMPSFAFGFFPFQSWPLGVISLPMDHMTTDGWLRSRRANARRLRLTYFSRFCSGRRPAVPSHLSKHSFHTTMPISSQSSSTCGSQALWLVRSAFAPMSFMIESWRFITLRLNAMPSGPMSACRSMPYSCTRRPFRWNPSSAVNSAVRTPKRTVRTSTASPVRTPISAT